MAEANHLKGVAIKDDQLLDGHKAIYLFKVYRLDAIERTFYPLEYNTHCLTIATSWILELKYERVAEDGGEESYTFSIKLKRKDALNHRVKASLDVSFTDIYETPMFYPLSSTKERMVTGDEIQASVDGILPTTLSDLVGVEVTITIKTCHTASDFQFQPNVGKNDKDLRKS